MTYHTISVDFHPWFFTLNILVSKTRSTHLRGWRLTDCGGSENSGGWRALLLSWNYSPQTHYCCFAGTTHSPKLTTAAYSIWPPPAHKHRGRGHPTSTTSVITGPHQLAIWEGIPRHTVWGVANGLHGLLECKLVLDPNAKNESVSIFLISPCCHTHTTKTFPL